MTRAFDKVAKSYDAEFSETVTGKAQRLRVWQFADKYFKAGRIVLEINCGTGVDALHYASKVKSIDACDISENMIDVCRAKQKKTAINNLNFFQSDIKDLDNLDKKYDLIFSDFAGLNCLDKTEMKNFARTTEKLLNPNGQLFFVLLGKKCIWENVFLTVKRDPRKGRRIDQKGSEVIIEGEKFKTWYYSKKELIEIFSSYDLIEARPVGLFLPPGFMEKRFKKNRLMFQALNVLETIFPFPALSDYGDHIAVVFRKKI